MRAISCSPEEIAYGAGWIDRNTLLAAADRFGKSSYGGYLRQLATDA